MPIYNRFRDLLGRATKAAPVKNQQRVLDDVAKAARESFAALTPGIVDRLLDSLFRASETTMRSDQTRRLLDTYSLIYERKAIFLQKVNQRFETNLALAFEKFLEKREEMKQPVATSADELSLMETEEVERMVLARNLVARLQSDHSELLFDIASRLATVAGISEVPQSMNPLQPSLVVDSIDEVWKSMRTDSSLDIVLLERLTPAAVGDLRPMYKSVIKTMADAGIEPTRPTIMTQQSTTRNAALGVPTAAVETGATESWNAPSAPMWETGALGEGVAAAPRMADPRAGAVPRSFFSRLQRMVSGAWFGGAPATPSGIGVAPTGGETPLPMLDPNFDPNSTSVYVGAGGFGGLPGGALGGASGAGGVGAGASGGAMLPAQMLSELVSRLPPVNAAATAPVALRAAAPQALSRLLPQGAGPNVVSALNYLQTAQVQQPEQFREALSPDFEQLQAEEGEALGYIDPLSPVDVALRGPVKFVNVVRSIQQSEIGQNATQFDAVVIELVARVFDFVFQDGNLPDTIKVLLSRLQIPVLKAAMLDPLFFEQDDHPSRQLVNALAAAGLGWQESDGRDDPLFAMIDRTVHRVIQEFKEDLSLFAELTEEVRAFVQKIEEQTRVEAAPEVQQVQQQAVQTENQELATRVARQAIEERLRDKTTVPFVSRFLRDAWAHYLCQLLMTAEGDTAQLSNAIATADDLLWSVEPKQDTLERARMLAKAPSIERQLKSGVTRIEWPREYAGAFFSALDDRWAGAVIGEPIILPDTLAAVTPTISPEDEDAEEDDSAMQTVMALEPGAIVEMIKDDGARFCYKLGWVSAGKTRFLLTNRLNSAPLIITATYMAERYRANKMRVIDNAPLMDRALNSILDALEETRYPEEMMHQTGAY